jgi:hypothetical protein
MRAKRTVKPVLSPRSDGDVDCFVIGAVVTSIRPALRSRLRLAVEVELYYLVVRVRVKVMIWTGEDEIVEVLGRNDAS